MVHQLAASVGISLPVGNAAAQSISDNWVLPAEWQLKMIRVTDGSTQSGDILAWPGHIGIAESGASGTNAISSTGSPGQCVPNINPPRGPRSLPASVFGAVSTRLRLVTTLSGTFDMPIRCAGTSSDAAVLRFEINNDAGGPFSSAGSGTDYDGAPLCFLLNGSYDQIENVVSATLSLCDNTRADGFSIELLTDDTGYFAMQKVIDNGGCLAEARLIRIQDPSSQALPAPRAPVSSSHTEQHNRAPTFGGGSQ
jgi:hypothetical protein